MTISSKKIRYEDRVLVLSVMAGVAAWIIDAAVDSWIFSRDTFINSVIRHVSPHEFYFRLFVMLTFILFGLAISITLARRKVVEKELWEALTKLEDEKARSEAIIAAIPDGISIQDRNYRVLYQNDRHRALVGDQLGKTCYEAYSNRDSICEGCTVALSFADGGNHIEQKSRPTDHGTMYIEISSAPLRNARGEIVAGIEAVRDITERKNSEQKLTLFSQAINEAMDGVQIVGLDGRVLYSNKAVEEIYGFTVGELMGRHVNEMNAEPEFAGDVIFPSIQDRGRWSGEVMVVHKSGRTFPIWLSTSIVKNDAGEPIAMVGIIRDITARKQAAEELRKHRERLEDLVNERTSELTTANARLELEIAERTRMEEELLRTQKLESLGVLAGGIAHDFNNLLGAIMGNVSLAMLDCDPAHSGFKQLSNAENAALRAQELTRQLLTFSKGGAPVKKLTSISRLAREAADFSLRGSRVRHDVSFPDDLWSVEADEGQMTQVFNNLLINADQAMPSGGVIALFAENVVLGPSEVQPLSAGKYVRITVRDQGTGIPADHLLRIFDPYFTTKQKGSGLGLAASFSIIRKHEGQITVESELGKGTSFHIYLPAAEGTPAKQKQTDTVMTGTGRVLVMDDEKDMRKTTGDMLVRLGYTVEFADDGDQAIELYTDARDAGRSFDLVIMDLTIPGGMGGKETMEKLLKIDPRVSAVVSSGYSHDPVMAEYQAYGFQGVVSKPYRLKELADVVSRVIKGRAG